MEPGLRHRGARDCHRPRYPDPGSHRRWQHVLDSYATHGQAQDIALEYFDDLLIVADGSAGVGSYAIGDGGVPEHLGTVNVGLSVDVITGITGEYFAGTTSGTLFSLRLDAENVPEIVDYIDLGGQIRGVVERGDTVIAAAGNDVVMVDASTLESLAIVARVTAPGSVLSLARSSTHLYAGVEGVGLVTYLISGTTFNLVDTLTLAAAPTRSFAWENRLYMVGPDLGVVVADTSLGDDVLALGHLDLDGAAGLALLGDVLVVGRGAQGVSTVNVGDCAQSGGSTTVYFIPAGARAAGVAGSFWLTDAAIANLSDGIATVNIAYLPKGQDNSHPLNVSMAIGSGEQILANDLFSSLFGLDAANGALRITASHRDVRATSRTYNAAGAEGTYGQFIPAFTNDQSAEPGVRGLLLQLQQNDAFRANVGMINETGMAVDVKIHLFTGDGVELGVVDDNLLPYEMMQRDRAFQAVTSEDVDSGYAVIEVLTEGGKVLAYASVVDNSSNDPIYISAQRLEGNF
jgi:hypothetical protein